MQIIQKSQLLLIFSISSYNLLRLAISYYNLWFCFFPRYSDSLFSFSFYYSFGSYCSSIFSCYSLLNFRDRYYAHSYRNCLRASPLNFSRSRSE